MDSKQRNKYRIELPNIIDDLKLSPSAFRLYVHIRRVAGARPGGLCWQSTITLAKACAMSAGSVSIKKKELLKPRPELGGKALIRKLGKKRGCDELQLVDIWDENYAHGSAMKNKKQDHLVKDQDSSYEDTIQQVNSNVHYMENHRSPSETKKEQREERTEEERTIEEPPISPIGDGGISNRESIETLEDRSEVSTMIQPDRGSVHVSEKSCVASSAESRRMIDGLLKIVPWLPNTKSENAALQGLCARIDAGTLNADQVIRCAEWMLEKLDRVTITAHNVENWLPTYIAKHEQKFSDTWDYEELLAEPSERFF